MCLLKFSLVRHRVQEYHVCTSESCIGEDECGPLSTGHWIHLWQESSECRDSKCLLNNKDPCATLKFLPLNM